MEVISAIRTIRKEKNIAFKDSIIVKVMNNNNSATSFDSVITKLGNISEYDYITEKEEGALTFRVQANEYFIPISGAINVEEEIKKLSEELKYTQGFLKSVQSKLANERFVAGAPQKVLDIERKKEADALSTIATLELSLANLK